MQGHFGMYQGSSNLQELHGLVKSTVMIRRLKKDVLSELPQKRRQQVWAWLPCIKFVCYELVNVSQFWSRWTAICFDVELWNFSCILQNLELRCYVKHNCYQSCIVESGNQVLWILQVFVSLEDKGIRLMRALFKQAWILYQTLVSS